MKDIVTIGLDILKLMKEAPDEKEIVKNDLAKYIQKKYELSKHKSWEIIKSLCTPKYNAKGVVHKSMLLDLKTNYSIERGTFLIQLEDDWKEATMDEARNILNGIYPSIALRSSRNNTRNLWGFESQ